MTKDLIEEDVTSKLYESIVALFHATAKSFISLKERHR
jgi:hypothetical protein